MITQEEKRKKINAAQNKRRAENRDSYNAKAREYREKNKEKINEQKRDPEKRIKLNEGVKRWRQENPEAYLSNLKEYRHKNKEKVYARNLVYKHVRRGHMVKPEKCEQCGNSYGKVHAHHNDYSKPLEVQWLCDLCHRHRHNKLLDVNP